MSFELSPRLCKVFTYPASKDENLNERRLMLRRQLEKVVDVAWKDFKN